MHFKEEEFELFECRKENIICSNRIAFIYKYKSIIVSLSVLVWIVLFFSDLVSLNVEI